MAFILNLNEQVAVVTGASSGIGAAIAKIFGQAGAQVVICDIKDEVEACDTIKAISEIGLKPKYVQADLSNQGEGTKVIEKVIEMFGRVDILVNNAALPSEDWGKSFSVNVVSPLELIEAAAEDMKKRSYGRVVNITSSSVFSGGTPIPQYVSTKGALDAMTRFLAKRYAPDGILVNSVAPGPVLTAMIQKRYSKDQFAEHYISQMPINRYLVPEDIAGAVLFLCSSLCSSICGETLLCDGGRVRLSVK
jgi:NAD(P)-dependent dehydrogenase (short-subunit alcohol dehydrogenase family)